ncbi:DMT family transporter [Gaiella sp.]|jgi:drug/metabolite transporter (DMT)-like permease|uniref:DMT family transporter n=1 Tax=Gaiella sp. TaxID=2663207 RepID=UPI002E3001E7|nr:DMT family transporter [Gaiella sp.]HEX5582460.1 DMT family transporter [Gaiella sp.]
MRTTNDMTRRGALLFAAMCVIWGIPYLLIKVAVEDMSPSVLVLGRTLIAAALLLPIAAVRGELRPLRPYVLAIAAFAGVEIALPWVLLGAAETEVSSSLTALLIAAVPLVATVIAMTTRGERLRPVNALGLALGILGVAAIVGLDVEGAHVVPLLEIGLVAVCYAVGPAILQRWLSHLPALGVIAASVALTALVYLPIAAFDLPDATPSAAALGSVLALAIVCTALAFVLFFALIAEVGPVRSTVITYVNPAVAAVLGVLILDEHFTVAMGVGFALVLAGSVLATRRGAAPTERPVAAAYPGSDSIAG